MVTHDREKVKKLTVEIEPSAIEVCVPTEEGESE